MFGFVGKSLAIIVGLALAALSLSAGAMANVPDSPPLDPIEIAQSDPGGGPSVQTALPDITCTLTVDYAHRSTHVPGTINVQGNHVCDSSVSQLDITVQLQKKACTPTCIWVNYGQAGSASKIGGSSVTANSAGNCTNGTYRGYATGVVYFPPNYVPTRDTSSAAGTAKSITGC